MSKRLRYPISTFSFIIGLKDNTIAAEDKFGTITVPDIKRMSAKADRKV